MQGTYRASRRRTTIDNELHVACTKAITRDSTRDPTGGQVQGLCLLVLSAELPLFRPYDGLPATLRLLKYALLGPVLVLVPLVALLARAAN